MSSTRFSSSLARPVLLVAALLVGAAASCTGSRLPLTPVAETATGAHEPGRFVWVDLLSHDVTASQRFYEALLGWTFEPLGEGDARYVVARHEGVPVAGIIPLPNGRQQSQWLSYLSVYDVDEAVESLVAGGGTVYLEPADFDARGRIALVGDPQGAVLAFIRTAGGDPPERSEPPPPGHWLWNELWTDDVQAAVDFYGQYGAYQAEAPPAELQRENYLVLKQGDRLRAGVFQIPGPNIRPNWLKFLRVEDPVAVAARAAELGGEVILSPEQVRGIEGAILRDPTGAVFAVVKWPPSQ
jgi:predicted enzyme related to lactoylglutathione lyase